MPYVAILLVQIVAQIRLLTTAIGNISGGTGGGGTYTPRIKIFYDQNGIVSGQNYAHNFQTTFGLDPSSYRIRVMGWDGDNYEVSGISAQVVDANTARLILADSGTPFYGDLQFYITPNPA